MKKVIKILIVLIIMVLISVTSFGKTKYRNKNIIIKETKRITLKNYNKGYLMYVLKKGRYRIKLSAKNIDYIDTYIVGQAEEFNPSIQSQTLSYEIDTDKIIEVFKQDYKANKNAKLKIELEKIE